MELALTQVKDVINRLQSPVPDISTLLGLLSGPLDHLHLLPPNYRKFSINTFPPNSINTSRHIPSIQSALLEHIVPTWESILKEHDAILLVEQYFCPDAFSFSSPTAGDIALLAYSTILSQPLTEYATSMLVRLTREYPIDRIHGTLFSKGSNNGSAKHVVSWEDCVRNIAAVSVKVANAQHKRGDVPLLLEHGTYFNNMSVRCEALIFSLSSSSLEENLSSVTYLLTKLVNLGVFPPLPPTSRSQPSFFQVTISTIRQRLAGAQSASYSKFWSELILSFPSTLALQIVVGSLFNSLAELSGTDPSDKQRALVKREAQLLRGILGPLRPSNSELWECVCALVVKREWNEGQARIFVCWAAGSESDEVDEEALENLLVEVSEVWSSSEHIMHSLLARHRYLTILFLVLVSYFPRSSNQIQTAALSPTLISGVGAYINHLDSSVRRCGMLAAEVVAQRAGKKLDFGDWDGDDHEKLWVRGVRDLLRSRDIDADVSILDESNEGTGPGNNLEKGSIPPGFIKKNFRPKPVLLERETGYDSDDSLTGYASPTSSRGTSPTPSELEELEKDPTLGASVKKIVRPVYLSQLGELVRSVGGLKSNDSSQEADRIEMALNCAEELIRKKQGYGTELDENAVNLVYGFVGLQDNFDLDNFEAKRQLALNALVTCCPFKAAPCITEQFFKNQYSINQRYAMLNALALGARALASMSPSSSLPTDIARVSFPSKVLPTSLHQKYIAAGNQDTNPIVAMLDDISREAVNRSKDSTADKIPALVRERQLRLRKPAKVLTVDDPKPKSYPVPTNIKFTEVAAEYFIAPLINRFWVFLRDEQTREERTANQQGRGRYRGAGTGLILNPVILARFLGTLAVLVHAAQNAPEWLAVVAPDALELAVTMGTRPISQMEEDDEENLNGVSDDFQGKEATVLTTSLELALIVLDGCLQIDGGKSLGLDHTALLLGTGEWAGAVFARLEKGSLVQGGGGRPEIKLKRAAAGVLLKVDELTSRWRRSMVDIR